MYTMQDVLKRLPRPLGPQTDGKTFIEIHNWCDFEGHGKASETWEEHWSIRFPQVPYYWKSLNGWTKTTNENHSMMIHGRTFDDVLTKAITFLDETKAIR
jgi:hypothetical protein